MRSGHRDPERYQRRHAELVVNLADGPFRGLARLSGLSPCVCRSGLARKPFTKDVRLYLPRERSGHEGVHDAVQPAWNDSGAVFEQTAEALRYALLDAHWFHRHGLRIEAELFEHRCVRKPGCQYRDVDT